MEFIGIDGCRIGWICIELGPKDHWQHKVVSSADELVVMVTAAKLSLIDIPIGLLDSAPDERACDRSARRVLGAPRASSVFPAPARGTLAAKNYQDASVRNRELTGRGLSRQTWAIAPKIREIDQLLCKHMELRGKLRECHPEVCFWSLNGLQSMQHNKKKPAGRDERITVLSLYLPQAREIVNAVAETWPRTQVARDDIVDALVAAVTAKIGYGNLMTLPDEPPVDACGLAMEMVVAGMSG